LVPGTRDCDFRGGREWVVSGFRRDASKNFWFVRLGGFFVCEWGCIAPRGG